MEDREFLCVAKALGDAARVAAVIKLFARVAKIWRKRTSRSKSEVP